MDGAAEVPGGLGGPRLEHLRSRKVSTAISWGGGGHGGGEEGGVLTIGSFHEECVPLHFGLHGAPRPVSAIGGPVTTVLRFCCS